MLYTVGMSWAAKRRLFITLIIIAVLVAFFSVVGVATLYEAPSCSDQTQNQEEAGVDCGGPCAYLCSFEARSPTVLFTKILSNAEGRFDVIASVENKNSGAAAKDISFTVELYGADRLLIATTRGTLDLPPGATVPVFIPGIGAGKQKPVAAFLRIDTATVAWYSSPKDPRILPVVSQTRETGTPQAPRIEAGLMNPTALPLINVKVVVLVRDAMREVIAASQSVVPVIPAQGESKAIFTWNKAFPNTPTTIEVVPLVPLPPR